MPVTGKFCGVGLGPGDPGLVTLKAAARLRSADFIFTAAAREGETGVSASVVAALDGISAPVTGLVFPMGLDWEERNAKIRENAALIAGKLSAGKNCVFASIGDPLTYSTCAYLAEALREIIPDLDAEIIPGVNSWSALAAKTGRALVEDQERLCVAPGYAPGGQEELDALLKDNQTVIILKTYRARNRLLEMLKDRPADIVYGSNIGLADQFVSSDPGEIAARPPEYLSMLMVRRRKGKTNV